MVLPADGPAGSTTSTPGTVSASSAFAARATVRSSVPLPLTNATESAAAWRVQPVGTGMVKPSGSRLSAVVSLAVVTFCAVNGDCPPTDRVSPQPPSVPATTSAAPARTRPVDRHGDGGAGRAGRGARPGSGPGSAASGAACRAAAGTRVEEVAEWRGGGGGGGGAARAG